MRRAKDMEPIADTETATEKKTGTESEAETGTETLVNHVHPKH